MGTFELVVLQGDIPEGDEATFNEYARKFIEEAKKSGTRPVLFMGWAYERLNWISQREIAQAHKILALETGTVVAPVGLAWSRVMAEHPALNLFAPDKEHPSASGSYLAACVVYATVMGQSPEGVMARDNTIGIESANYLEQVAWQVVQAY